MRVRTITINGAGMVPAGRSAPEKGQLTEPKGNMFGPEYKVTISQTGRNLNGLQKVQTETGNGNASNVREEKMALRRGEAAERAKEIRESYREELNEIEEQIKELNTSYVEMESGRKFSGAASIKETLEELEELKKAMQKQKRFLEEDGKKRLREAQQMAGQFAQYQEEIDKNNRDLTALLKSMEEEQKTKDGRIEGSAEDGNDTSNAEDSKRNAIQNSASQFVASFGNRERGVKEMLVSLGDSGRWFLSAADDITQNVFRKSVNIKAALENDAFTDGEIEKMMQSFREDTVLDRVDIEEFRAFGMRVLREVREAGLQHIADDPQRSMQETRENIMQAASHVAVGEARQESLDKASQELAEEVQELIDRRNDIEQTGEDKEEEKKEQTEKNNTLYEEGKHYDHRIQR